MRVLVVDLQSKLNRFGGQAKVASILVKGLSKYFSTYYLGYETEYLKTVKAKKIMLPRGRILNTQLRKSWLSELAPSRALYYLIIVRNLAALGMSKDRVLEEVKRISPDVIIANSVQDFALFSYLKRSGLRFKSMYIDHGSVSSEFVSGYFSKEGVQLTVGSGIHGLSVNSIKRKFFNFFDMNIALNKSQERSMLRFTKKVACIPNGLSVHAPRNPSIENKLRSKYGINKNDFVVLYLGRMFERQKRVSTLINAFHELKSKDLKLLLVGEGPSLSDYISLAKGDRRVIFAGSVEDKLVNHVYEISSLFVLPSLWEGLSIVVLEAAAHSLPLILSTNACIEDFRVGRSAKILTFKTGDHMELSRLIDLVFKSRSVREHAIQVSRSISRAFTEQRMLGEYRQLIERMGVER